jgi:nitroreductase
MDRMSASGLDPHPISPQANGFDGLGAPLREAVLGARLAPSAHNAQPWRFRLLPDGLELGWAAERELPFGDPHGAYLMIGLGAAAEAASLGIALRNQRGLVTWDLDQRSRTAASVRATAEEPSARDRELAASLPDRATTRLPFDRSQLQSSLLRSCAREAEGGGMSLAVVTGPSRVEQFADLVAEGTARNLADRSVYEEFHGWLRLGRVERRAVDGLTGSALGFGRLRGTAARPLMSLSAMSLWRSFGAHRLFAATQRRLARRSGAACLLVTGSGESGDLFAGGRVMLRVWLAATLMGLRLHPMTAVMDHAQTREGTAELFGVPADAAMIVCFRLGFGPAGARAPRIPAADLIERPLDGDGPAMRRFR